MYAYRFRVLRFAAEAKPITIYYATRAALERGAQRWADRDGSNVGVEEFQNMNEEFEDPFWEWGLFGVVKPA